MGLTVIAATFALSALCCGVYLRYARARSILDSPNERSSHTVPTPHGGGVPLLLAFTFGLALSGWVYGDWGLPFITLVVAALALAFVGVVDDVRGLPVGLRLAIYALLCVLVTVVLMRGVPAANFLAWWVLVLFAASVMLWFLNLYNFMDGIDGIAAIQAIVACFCAAWLAWLAGKDIHYVVFCLLLAAAHGGFLVWNLPPARLFLGDAGSVPTGFLMAALALLGAVQDQLNPFCWLILLAVFITDASWTLLWRLASGQAVMQPHRSHAYQRLSRYWGSHLRVDLLLLVINVIWLFPLAAAVQAWPDHSLFLVFLAYLPLLCGMAKIRRLA